MKPNARIDDGQELVDSIVASAELTAKLLQVFASCTTDRQVEVAVNYFRRMQKVHPELSYGEVACNLGKIETVRHKLDRQLPSWMAHTLCLLPMRVQDCFWREFPQFLHQRSDWSPTRVPLNDHGVYIPGTGY